MTTEQTTDTFETAEYELEPAAEAPADEVPVWTPEDGDFT